MKRKPKKLRHVISEVIDVTISSYFGNHHNVQTIAGVAFSKKYYTDSPKTITRSSWNGFPPHSQATFSADLVEATFGVFTSLTYPRRVYLSNLL